MKTAIYSPYLDTASGGEKYMLTIAEVLSGKGTVDVLLDSHLWELGAEKIKKLNSERHNLDLKEVNFIEAPVGPTSKFGDRNKFLKQYDLLFYLSDGSIFYSTAKKNVVHFQMPLDQIQRSGVWNKIKWRTWKKIIYNSEFTKGLIERKIGMKSKGEVVYPPVDIKRFKKITKKNYILNVGRFVGDGVKKQDVLIKAFKQLTNKNGLKGWQFHLAGALRDSDKKYFEGLMDLVGDSAIYFHPNISFSDLTSLYNESKIYWHAMGFNEEDPKKMEHFGISTVEAMASGCVPVVIKKGGQVEIVREGVDGFLWNSLDSLEEKTLELINDEKMISRLSESAVERSSEFSEDEFTRKIQSLI